MYKHNDSSITEKHEIICGNDYTENLTETSGRKKKDQVSEKQKTFLNKQQVKKKKKKFTSKVLSKIFAFLKIRYS